MEQRYFIKCMHLSGEPPIKIIENLKEWFGNNALCRTQEYFWIAEIKRGRNDLSDSPRPGRPRNENIDDEIKSILQVQPYATIRVMPVIIGFSPDYVFNLLHALGLKNVFLRWVPHFLSPIQKSQRENLAKELLQILLESKETNFTDIITGDESWFVYYYQYDKKWVVETDEIPEKVVPSQYDKKTIVTIFIGIKGLVFRTIKEANKSWNSDYFINDVLKPISELKKVKKLKRNKRLCRLHYDNARCHVSQKVKKYLFNSPFSLIPYPLYSPDLSPCDFGLFGTMKNSFKGRSFDTEEDLLNAIDEFFAEKSPHFWLSIFESWIKRCEACITAKGNYF